jgi:hypothetical protein
MLYLAFTLAVILPSPFLAQAGGTWEEVRKIALAQHEIVMLLIEKKEFEKVPDAAREIFTLPFPPDQEHRVVKEAELLSDALQHHGQFEVAHLMLDMAMNCVSTTKAQAQLHREKAFLLKKEGKTDEAMEAFQKSVELEKGKKP